MYTFNKLALPPHQLPPEHDIALSKDRTILYISYTSVRNLLVDGECNCKMGQDHIVHIKTENFKEPVSNE